MRLQINSTAREFSHDISNCAASAPRSRPATALRAASRSEGGRDNVERAYRHQQQVADAYTRYRNSIPEGVDPDELRDNAGIFGMTDAARSLQPALDAVQADADAATRRRRQERESA